MNQDEPLIYTTLGNVPVSSLKYEAQWRVTDRIAHFTETYHSADGVLVRQDSHVYAFGVESTADATQPQPEGA